ncbi:hypothetical protein UlMin_032478 [Ulmus minor]
MKREGRQHGMVRITRILPSHLNPRPETRFVNRFDSPTTAGSFTRVSSKPTNHSKFTGKCGQPRCNGCHLHPACKAKNKTKGAQKLKSLEVNSSCKLNYLSGFSVKRVLGKLSSYYVNENDDDETGGYCVDGDEDYEQINC